MITHPLLRINRRSIRSARILRSCRETRGLPLLHWRVSCRRTFGLRNVEGSIVPTVATLPAPMWYKSHGACGIQVTRGVGVEHAQDVDFAGIHDSGSPFQ